jgi:hypothetical protein
MRMIYSTAEGRRQWRLRPLRVHVKELGNLHTNAGTRATVLAETIFQLTFPFLSSALRFILGPMGGASYSAPVSAH